MDELEALNFYLAGVDPGLGGRIDKVAGEQAASYTPRQVALAASLAKTAFEEAGINDNLAYDAFCSIVRNPSDSPGHRKIASVVFTCMGRVMRKEAVAFPGIAKAINLGKATVTGATSLTPDVAKVLIGAGGLTGALGGSAVFAAQKGLSRQDAKLREEEERRDTYNRLAREVQEELKRRNLDPTPANQAAVVDYLT